MLRTWPEQPGWYPGARTAPSNTSRMLSLLSQLQDTARLAACLAALATDGFTQGDSEAIVRAASLLPAERAVTLIERLMAGQAATNLRACGNLLARSVATRLTEHPADFSAAASVLAAALPGDPTRPPRRDPWGRPPTVDSTFIVDLLTALEPINTALAEQAAEYLLAWPQTYGLAAVSVPAVTSIATLASVAPTPAEMGRGWR